MCVGRAQGAASVLRMRRVTGLPTFALKNANSSACTFLLFPLRNSQQTLDFKNLCDGSVAEPIKLQEFYLKKYFYKITLAENIPFTSSE